MKPKMINGDCFEDDRGSLYYNNSFDVTVIKRVYIIKNKDNFIIRGWQGHKIEQRWFSAITGSFRIKLIRIDNWESPSKDLPVILHKINADRLDVLHVPKGYVTSIQAISEKAKLLVMADFLLGETKDEYRYPINYFE